MGHFIPLVRNFLITLQFKPLRHPRPKSSRGHRFLLFESRFEWKDSRPSSRLASELQTNLDGASGENCWPGPPSDLPYRGAERAELLTFGLSLPFVWSSIPYFPLCFEHYFFLSHLAGSRYNQAAPSTMYVYILLYPISFRSTKQ